MFAGRKTIEIVVLLFALTACAALLLTGAAVAVLILTPTVDHAGLNLAPTVEFLQTTVGLIIGALLGLLVKGGQGGDGGRSGD